MNNNNRFRHILLGFFPHHYYEIGYLDTHDNWLPIVVSGYYVDIKNCRNDAEASKLSVEKAYIKSERQRYIKAAYY